MPTEPPPSRYRVIERGKRLEVIDTWAGRSPVPPSPSPAPQPVAEAQPFVDFPDLSDAELASPPVLRPAPPPDRPGFATIAAPPPPSQRAPDAFAKQPDLFSNLAAIMCGDRRDADGRLILGTAAWYDGKAPRDIALDRDGQREVGLVSLLLAIGMLGVLFFGMTLGFVWLLLPVVALSVVKPKVLATPWLDRLAARTR